MKKTSAHIPLFVLFAMLVNSANAQEDVLVTNPQEGTVQWLDRSLLTHVEFFLPAEDGMYAAQNEAELQTYYDLGLSYQFIESPAIRTQLKLSNGEGIMINSAREDAEGYRLGFRPGDIVLRVNQEPVVTQYEFVISVTETRGQETRAAIRRAGEEVELDFVLSEVSSEKNPTFVIGVSADDMNEVLRSHLNVEGVVLTSIREGSPAEAMGLKVNDIVCRVDDIVISTPEVLRTIVQESQGKVLNLELLRSGNKMTVELKPEQNDQPVDLTLYQAKWLTELAYHQLAAQDPNEYRQLSPTELSLQWIEMAGLQKHSTDQQQEQLENISRQLEDLQKQLNELRESIKK